MMWPGILKLLSWGLTAAKHQNFCRSKVRRGSLICFALEGAWIPSFCVSRWKALIWVLNFEVVNVLHLNLYEFVKRRIHAFVGKLKERHFCWFPAAISLRIRDTNMASPYKALLNIIFFGSLINIARTWCVARLFTYSFVSKILDFLYLMVCSFY